ncbi:hypothetical protein [Pseudovibrio sp. Ad37]|uniref:hypothetical protein n=1 Tax=Pseudovibrio sp. Ad37 TaxID=989422 RepID=UPI0007AE6DC9|nr:hypothetical protein [Pseudovibrio sp. Ad37]KZL14863.1 hypothetical protein PsAD37_04741 [Pseudovibrio sp. Ad37]
MLSNFDQNKEKKVQVELSETELRYLVGASLGLLQNIPANSLSTYVNLNVDEIVEFSAKIRSIMDENDISM